MKSYWILASAAALLLAACSPAEAKSDLAADLEMLAAEQHPEALYHLGMMYLVGAEVETDRTRALDFFRRSAELGDPLAAYKIGCFYDGQYDLLEVDVAAALEHKMIAAEAGYALAQQDVALLLYRAGDIDAALDWLKRAADQGTRGALMAYASIHNGVENIPEDPVKTAAYFTLYLDLHGGSEAQREWLRGISATLTPRQAEEVARIVAQYRPAPTPLTRKALSGMEAAQSLAASAR